MRLLLIVASFSLLCLGCASEVPAWTSRLLLSLKERKIWTDVPHYWTEPDYVGRHGNPPTRYRNALATYECYVNLQSLLEDRKAGTQKGFLASTLHPRETALNAAVNDTLRLMREFSPEIKKLGGDPAAIIEELKQLSRAFLPVGETPSFPDVPPDHWAARAVAELKAAGILHGYGPKRFGG